MAFEIMDPQPAPRSEPDYDQRAPGLYMEDNETAVRLDTGQYVAVSVMPTWLDNGAGVNLKSCARWIDEDGSTHLCPQGQHVETWATHSASMWEVTTFTTPALSKDMLLIVLGEEPVLTKEVPEAEGKVSHRIVIDISGEAKLNANIRHAIASIAEVQELAGTNAANLLGLN